MFKVIKGQSNDCPTWTLPTNDSHQCVCGNDVHHIIKCNNKTKKVHVLGCYLITYDSESQDTILGSSVHGCYSSRFDIKRWHTPLYSKVPSNVSEIDAVVCAPLNRTGRLCGSCINGYYPLVYSYKFDCVPCTDMESRRNWILYMLRAFLPLTFFYVFVVLLKFHAHHPSVHVYILFSQMCTSPALVRTMYRYANGIKIEVIALDIFCTIYGVWNLDFFRAIYPDICLKITQVQALFLDYTIAFYPLLLILVTYVLATLHSNGNRIVLMVWRPFHWALVHFRNTWDIRSSMIDVFTTFLFLSYNRITSITFDLLIYVRPYILDRSSTKLYLFYDASIEYFGPKHTIYGATAVIVYTIFVFLPLLLIVLYPFRCFQKCLNCFRLNRITLDTFVDSIAGYYKDGTEHGTRDCRCFAAAFLFLPTLLYLSYALVLNSYYFAVGGLVVTIFCLMFTLCQPYKEAYKQYGRVTTVLLVLMIFSLFMILGADIASMKLYQAYHASLSVIAFMSFLPAVYLTALALKWLYLHTERSLLYCFILQRMRPLANASSPTSESSLISAFEERSRALNKSSMINA